MMIRETLRSVLLFNMKFWGSVTLLGLAVLIVGISRAGGLQGYMKATFSALSIYGLIILMIAEIILSIGYVLTRGKGNTEPSA